MLSGVKHLLFTESGAGYAISIAVAPDQLMSKPQSVVGDIAIYQQLPTIGEVGFRSAYTSGRIGPS